MLFWTVIFFTVNLMYLIRNPAEKAIIKLGELKIEEAEGKYLNEKQKKEMLNNSLVIFFVNLMDLGEFIYLINVLKTDVLKYPTIIVLILTISLFFRKSKLSGDLSTKETISEYREKLYKQNHSKRIIISLIYCSYYAYMFYILVF